MGRYFLEYSGLGCRPAYDVKHHDAGQPPSAAVEKEYAFVAPAYVGHAVAVGEPLLYLAYGRGGEWHEAFLVAFTHHYEKSFGDEDAVDLEVDELAHAEAAGVEGLDDGAVALAFGLRHIYRRLHGVDLGHREGVGEMAGGRWRLKEFGGVGADARLGGHEAEEGFYARYYSCLRGGADANVVESGGKGAEGVERHIGRSYASVVDKIEQLGGVARVGFEGIGREAPFEPHMGLEKVDQGYRPGCHGMATSRRCRGMPLRRQKMAMEGPRNITPHSSVAAHRSRSTMASGSVAT